MKKCKICGRRKEFHHYGYSRRAEDGHKAVCNECANKKTDPASKEPAPNGPTEFRKWDGQLYTGEPPMFQRNTGHKHIKSRGDGC